MTQVENAQETQEPTQVESPKPKTEAERLASATALISKKPAEEPKKPETPPEPQAPQLAAAIQRERQIEAKRAALAKERQEFEAHKASSIAAEIEKAKQAAVAELEELARTDPDAFLERVKVGDRDAWLQTAYYAKVPDDKRPRDWKHRITLSEQLRKEAEARSKLEARVSKYEEEKVAAEKKAKEDAAAAAEQEQIAAYRATLPTGIEKLPKDKNYLRTLLANDKDEAERLMFTAAVQIVKETKEAPTPDQVAEVVENHLSSFAVKLVPKTTTQAEGETRKPAKTLTSQNTATPTVARSPATTEAERLKRASERAAGIFK